MLNLTDLKPGIAFELEGQPYIVMYSEHSKLGRGGAIMRTKIRNLLTSAIVERTFKGSENFLEVDLEYKKSQYLYKDGEDYFFMYSNMPKALPSGSSAKAHQPKPVISIFGTTILLPNDSTFLLYSSTDSTEM